MLWAALLLPPGPTARPRPMRRFAAWRLGPSVHTPGCHRRRSRPHGGRGQHAPVRRQARAARPRRPGGRRPGRDPARLGPQQPGRARAGARRHRERLQAAAATSCSTRCRWRRSAAVRPHRATLARLGCQTLGEVRALPRGGLSRRFDKQLLARWTRPTACARGAHLGRAARDLQRPAGADVAGGDWRRPCCSARDACCCRCAAGWRRGTAASPRSRCAGAHDAMRSQGRRRGRRDDGAHGQPTRDIEHLCRLLAEHLAKVAAAGAGGRPGAAPTEVHVAARRRAPRCCPTAAGRARLCSWCSSASPRGWARSACCGPVLTEDHRLEWMSTGSRRPSRGRASAPRRIDMPQPTFVLPEPLKLATRGRPAAVPGRAAAAGRPAPRRRRLVGPARRGRASDDPPRRARLLGRAQRARRRAVGLPGRGWPATRPPGSCTACSPEQAIAADDACDLPDYAELRCVSNFSFLRGASQPEELVERAKQLGYTALALTDECSMAGIVRAHVAAKKHGLKLLVGSQFQVDGHGRCRPAPFSLSVLACNLQRLRQPVRVHHQAAPRSRRRAPTTSTSRTSAADELADCVVIAVAGAQRHEPAQLRRPGAVAADALHRPLLARRRAAAPARRRDVAAPAARGQRAVARSRWWPPATCTCTCARASRCRTC